MEEENTVQVTEETLSFEDKVELVYQYLEILKAQEEIKKSCDKIIKETTPKVELLKKEILAEMESKGEKEIFVRDKLYATVGVNTSTGYADEEAVIKYLQDNHYDKFVKVTTAINKKDLNAELKKNEALKKDIDSFITTNVTTYVTVTNEENHTKMLEYIEESKKKGK